MARFKLTVEYHGGPFVGWQRQADGLSVQGVIEAALSKLTRSKAAPTVSGAGRTDAGVHATGQVCHCDMPAEWEAFRLSEALNHHVKPHPVSIVAAEKVDDTFHARFSAVRRHYLYRIVNRRAPLALDYGLAWKVANSLDVEAMNEAAAMLVGRHDFTTYRSSHCQAASPEKTLDHFSVSHHGDEILFWLHARSFLHNQVRSLVGTLERVGAGKMPVAGPRMALESKDRSACGPVAPPSGLYLTAVDYDDDATSCSVERSRDQDTVNNSADISSSN
ncbi:MAG: tRNA pseudouridine(38-40) synthase TruA [Pseudomonadota bacterium]